MFDVSFTELIVIGVVALIVLGPERLPKVARTVGHLLGRAQRYVNDVKSDIQREIELDELRKFKQQMDSTAQDVNQSLQQATESIRSTGDTLRAELDDTARAVNEAAADIERSIAPPAAPAIAKEDTPPAGEPAVHGAPVPAAAPEAPSAAPKTPPTGNAT
ncbi:Sec-independent protein translocase protein TatB [Bordetella hinzii]|uniref:Sec-independent protein translocase protein TatB n=2 Tax=Bordetella hinzii TaxID=103855 RepID=A0AAN1VFF7_9BORD|nr:Sec-independent protein translocase protein TatB [Bordetella hinzii]AKQ57777.1 Sec-independent protein translocase protein TatB [Bordetella hinzii]AKQ62243.1 Sec-independent protein translocase protein TatB [Bordetella hinzii]AZW16856.1 twin-arginine translocase subunit TatB [Bordetella hinzii]KCB24035.1 twin arginine-targeting protein translocase TatB [Bordetella hinzii OH87 BAL007II]KCB28169.1 twin arginine-targeting protein translocase TatB [Bordetella hinzii CA90 BAL1384]